MLWNSASDFFAMGGYGFYVWGSFGVTALALVAEVWLVRARHAAARQSIRNETQDGSGSRS